jgi:hypothetical protein
MSWYAVIIYAFRPADASIVTNHQQPVWVSLYACMPLAWMLLLVFICSLFNWL